MYKKQEKDTPKDVQFSILEIYDYLVIWQGIINVADINKFA